MLAWPRLALPCLQLDSELEIRPGERCSVRRTRAMDELEGRLQQAMVVYVGGDRSELSPELVLMALRERLGIPADRVSVHRFRPEDFLVVFARKEDRFRVGLKPVLEFQGKRLSFRQWIRQN